MLTPNLILRQLSWVLLLACISVRSAHGEEQRTIAQLANKIDTELVATPNTSGLRGNQELTANVLQQLTLLKEQSIMVFGARRQQLEEKLQELGTSCEEWQRASALEAARAAAERGQRLWREIKSLYPKEALQILPPLWSCPMHQELMKTTPGNCPICGMPVEPIYVTQPQLT